MNSICHIRLDDVYGADLNTNLSFGSIVLLANIYAIIHIFTSATEGTGVKQKIVEYFVRVFCIFNFRIKFIAWTAIR